MKINLLSIGMLISLSVSLVGCQTTATSTSPVATSSLLTAAEPLSASDAAARRIEQAKLEPNIVSTLIRRVHTRFYHSHLNQSLSDAERERNTFNSIIATEITGKCLFTPDEVQVLRDQTQSAMITEASQGVFDRANVLLTHIDARHQEKLDYQKHLLEPNSNLTTDASAVLVTCWQRQVEADKQWLVRMGYPVEDATVFLKHQYASNRESLRAQSLRQRAERWSTAYAKGYGQSNGYLPNDRGTGLIDGEEGIGVMLAPHNYGAEVVGGSAFAVNPDFNTGDIIVAYADEQQAMVPLLHTSLDRINTLVRGQPGTHLKLWVYVPESGTFRTVQATRGKAARMPGISYTLAADNQVALVRLSSITVGVSDALATILRTLQQQGTDTLVLDLCGNGGGVLSELSKILGQFGINGNAFIVRSVDKISVQQAEVASQPYTGNVVVLVNRETASGAELIAATLQDYGGALIVGEMTYGAGTVQQHRSLDLIYDLFTDKLGYVSYTIAMLHRVDGTQLHHRGVTPDIMIPQRGTRELQANALGIKDIETDWRPRQQQAGHIARLKKHYGDLSQSQYSESETTALAIEIALDQG
ncbi:S41 family peptidase [Photobacterium sp. MCCC 1A19761]|uniref:S41 family peptidase n=1 Tax=Photobacterium sp. MCCC 1A19761 TaxID=3115000 RepID=UPI00307E879B